MTYWTYSREYTRFPLMAATGYTLGGNARNMMYNPESKYCYTVVDNSARHVKYFWDLNNPKWQELDTIAAQLGFTGDCPSWSRLSKFVYETHVTPHKSGIRTHRDFERMAHLGCFWHFHKVVPGSHGNTFELDVKGAYARSVTKADSLWLVAPFRSADDGGAMERFKALIPILPKKMRLCLIGFLSSNTMTHWRKHPTREGELKKHCFFHCFDGGVFNRIHASLAGLFTFLEEMERIACQDIIRMHTDSLLVKTTISTKNLNALFRKAEQSGYELAVKGHGDAVLFDLNAGVIGGRIIGNPRSVLIQWDNYIKGIEREALRVAELDRRVAHLPYKNERFSIRQSREIIGMKPHNIVLEGDEF